jgi:hypothetical protein
MRAMRRLQPSSAPFIQNFHHCSDGEYATFLAGLPVTPEFRRMRCRYCGFRGKSPANPR